MRSFILTIAVVLMVGCSGSGPFKPATPSKPGRIYGAIPGTGAFDSTNFNWTGSKMRLQTNQTLGSMLLKKGGLIVTNDGSTQPFVSFSQGEISGFGADPRNYGAIVDGHHDDQPAYEAAMASGAQLIHIPQGKSFLANPILVTGNVIFDGAGGMNKPILLTTNGNPAFRIENAFLYYDVGVRHCTIQGNLSGNGILATNANQLVIEDVEVGQARDYGFELQSCSIASIKNNFLWGFARTNSIGLHLGNGSGFDIDGNSFYTQGIAIRLENPSNGQTFLNTVMGANWIGISIPTLQFPNGSVGFNGLFIEGVAYPFDIGASGSGTNFPGPIALRDVEIAATSPPTNCIIAGANGLILDNFRCKVPFTLGTNVTGLDIVGAIQLTAGFTNNATYADKTVGNLTVNGDLFIKGSIRGVGNSPVVIKAFPQMNIQFAHTGTNEVDVNALDDTMTNSANIVISGSLLRLNGRPIQLHIIPDQNLFYDTAGGHLQLSALSDDKLTYKPFDTFGASYYVDPSASFGANSTVTGNVKANNYLANDNSIGMTTTNMFTATGTNWTQIIKNGLIISINHSP